MEFIGLSAIETIINIFLEKFDLTASLGTDFCFYFNEDRIEYALVAEAGSLDRFMSVVHSINPAGKADPFLYALLHEVGHSETWGLLTDEELADSRRLKEEGIYYTAPDEFAATEWAVRYIDSHPAEIDRLWAELQPAIGNFYRLNNIEI